MGTGMAPPPGMSGLYILLYLLWLRKEQEWLQLSVWGDGNQVDLISHAFLLEECLGGKRVPRLLCHRTRFQPRKALPKRRLKVQPKGRA